MTTKMLRAYLEECTQHWHQAVRPAGLTVGVEHEFFLYGMNGAPASHGTSQQFFQALAADGWQLVSTREALLGTYYVACTRTHVEGRVTIKYEHHPHLLEVVLPPVTNLRAYPDLWSAVWADVRRACAKRGLAAQCEPQCRVRPDDMRLWSDAELPTRLRAYRRRQADTRGVRLDRGAENFSAGIASTQIHVGGMPWIQDASVVNDLYRMEPDMLMAEVALLVSSGQSRSVLGQRWKAYCRGGFGPLVGFPDFRSWSIGRWVSALLQAPHLEDRIPASPECYLRSARDNQVIKPRTFGTLEFRSAPAQASPANMWALAALRLGACAHVLRGLDGAVPRTYSQAHTAWWGAACDQTFSERATQAIHIARQGLRLRSMGEAALLEPLNQHA